MPRSQTPVQTQPLRFLSPIARHSRVLQRVDDNVKPDHKSMGLPAASWRGLRCEHVRTECWSDSRLQGCAICGRASSSASMSTSLASWRQVTIFVGFLHISKGAAEAGPTEALAQWVVGMAATRQLSVALRPWSMRTDLECCLYANLTLTAALLPKLNSYADCNVAARSAMSSWTHPKALPSPNRLQAA